MRSVILHNGIITAAEFPNATALVARNGIISLIGSDHAALAHRESGETVVDLQGRVVIPGFGDCHGHLLGLGAKLTTLQLHGCSSVEDVALRVGEWLRLHPGDTWVIGMGWNQELWNEKKFPSKEILDAVAPHTPVYLTRIDGHAAWTNSETLRRAGIDRVRIVDGGEIVGDATGQPTGVLIDNALALVANILPSANEKIIAERFRCAIKHLHGHGITMVHDMDVDPFVLPILRRVLEEPGHHLRVSSWIRGQNFEWQKAWPGKSIAEVRAEFNSEYVHVDGVKFYVDGALGSRGAWLHDPYADAPTSCGLQLLDDIALRDLMHAAVHDGFAVALHAIGDAAVHAALNACEEIRGKYSERVLRIEHAQIIDPLDIPRFAQLGVIPSVQPPQRASDAVWIADRLGDRVRNAFPFRALIDAGAQLLGGSDFPIEEPDCLDGMIAATGGSSWQQLTSQEAYHIYTTWSRRTTSINGKSGSIAVGQEADLTILSHELYSAALPSVEMTIVGGAIVYK